MRTLDLLAIGDVPFAMLQNLAQGLADAFRIACEIMPSQLSPNFAFHGERRQYHSSQILIKMQERLRQNTWRILGVTTVDLYIPILTFVFGEAQIGGPCAVVSAYRLRQEFYGLEANPELMAERLLKESVHEIGHTLELMHCQDYRCAMAPSHEVEWIDLKDRTLCPSCSSRIFSPSL